MTDFSAIANEGKKFACSLYRAQPGALVPTPMSDLLHLIWDNFCGDPPPGDTPQLPPPPAPAFQGGQCCDVRYSYDTYLYGSNGSVSGTVPSVPGAIIGTFPDIVTGDITYWYVHRQRCNGAIERDFIGTAYNPSGCNITAVRRLDGLPDSCGNPPSNFPPSPPPPPDGYTSPPTPITFNDNSSTNFIFNFNPPVLPPSPIDSPPPIVINFQNTNNDFKIPMTFNFNGGVSFGGGGDSNFNKDDRKKLGDTYNNTNNLNNNFNNFNNIYNFNTVPPDYDDSPKVEHYDTPPAPDKKEDKDSLLGVRITLSKMPDKAQFGNPTVYFGGWVTFKLNDGYSPREQVNFKESYFQAPPGATGYAYTLTNGAIGSARVYSKKPED